MQGLAVFLGVVMMGYGFSAGGLTGALTGAVAVITVGSGLAILFGEAGTGVSEPGTIARSAQRIGGLIAALGGLVGAFYGGWSWGWAWALGGYAVGMLTSLLIGLTSAHKAQTR